MQIESIIAIIIAIVLILEIIGYYLFYIKIKKHNDEIYNILYFPLSFLLEVNNECRW